MQTSVKRGSAVERVYDDGGAASWNATLPATNLNERGGFVSNIYKGVTELWLSIPIPGVSALRAARWQTKLASFLPHPFEDEEARNRASNAMGT